MKEIEFSFIPFYTNILLISSGPRGGVKHAAGRGRRAAALHQARQARPAAADRQGGGGDAIKEKIDTE